MTQYQALPNNKVYGALLVEEIDNNQTWQEPFFAEAWFETGSFNFSQDSTDDRSNSKFTLSYACLLYTSDAAADP